MNQNLSDAPQVPPRMLPNVYGESLARWYIDGFYFGPNKEAIPEEIAMMPVIQDAEIALKNWKALENQRQQEMTETADAEALKEQEAAEEAERREKQDVEDEIERRVQKRVAKIIADGGNKPPAGDPVVTADDSKDDVATGDTNTDAPDTSAEPAKKLTPEEELAAIFTKCETKVELETQLADVAWQHIKKAVVKLGKTPGKKAQNIEILAEYLEIE